MVPALGVLWILGGLVLLRLCSRVPTEQRVPIAVLPCMGVLGGVAFVVYGLAF